MKINVLARVVSSEASLLGWQTATLLFNEAMIILIISCIFIYYFVSKFPKLLLKTVFSYIKVKQEILCTINRE